MWQTAFYWLSFHGCPDILQHDLHAAVAASHEHTGKYFSGRLYLYYDYLRWPDRYDFYNLLSSYLRAVGNSQTPLMFLIFRLY